MHLLKKHLDKLRSKYALTAREIEYIMVFFRGINDNSEIAQILGNTLLTAKIHITNIYKKLHESSKIGVVIKIIDELKLLPFDIKDPPKEIVENFRNKYNLTNRETDLLLTICKSVTSNKDIGKIMNIAFETIQKHLIFIYRKTFTHNKLALFMKFIEESQERSDFFDNIGYTQAATEN